MPKLLLVLVPVFATLACASAEKPRSASPSSPRCAFVRMELDERAALEDSDSVSLMLVYTPPGAGREDAPVSAAMRVQRNRVDDIAAQLRTKPELICEPEAGAPGGYRALLP
jgi:hypothetical protein